MRTPSIASQVLTSDEECDIAAEFAPNSPASGPLSEALTLTDNSLNVTGAQQSIGVAGTATLTVGTTLTINAGTPQSAYVTDRLCHPLAATLTDAYGNPEAGDTVTFTSPLQGQAPCCQRRLRPTNMA